MKKITNRFDETIWMDTTSSGLEVMLVHKPGFKNQAAYLATPFGGIHIKQWVNDQLVEYPAGLAHFLEHKLFEGEQEDIMAAFTSMGASVNAYTSSTETVYYFATTSDFIKPLHTLLDFVYSISISDESVEKEKGIIIQELSMYEQMPNMRIFNETYQSLYHNHPYQFDIGGTKESVSNTTTQLLQQAYQINYHPTNMILVIVCADSPQLIFDEVNKNLESKTFGPKPMIKPFVENEPASVKRESFDYNMDVITPKCTVNYKLPIQPLTQKAAIQQQWSMQLLLEAHFSMVNPSYQQWVDQQLVNDSFDIDVDIQVDAAHIIFYIETDNPTQFKQFISEQISTIECSIDKLTQLKKRFVGLNVRAFNRQDVLASNIIHYHFKKVPFVDILDIIEDIQMQDIVNSKLLINQAEICTVSLFPFA